jgi:two-component system, cell cycle sensor histidine kinase and response regulator CckA
MRSPLRILHLEDDPDDASLVESTLESEGIPCSTIRVQDRDHFVAALESGGIDLILSDFSLPVFDGFSAIATVRARWPDLPVILVSGSMGEQRAIDSLKSGATDYVLKEQLFRLAPAVRRAMREVDDRSERRRLEAHFVEAQKMKVIGQLVSGVAHDFNNILAVIIGYSDLITGDADLEGPLRKYIDEIRHASERAAGLTRQLLVFGRKQKVIPVVLDLNKVVLDLKEMLRRLIDENIEMTTVLEDNIGHVRVDAGYVGQVLMNLVVNARDAMCNGGQLTIATSNVTLEEGELRGLRGDYVMLSVGDTGTGMTNEVKALLFEAFFTTKPVGKGTGLGLVTCQTIVHQSGGYIDVCSEVGKGSVFKVYFPRVVLPLDFTAGTISAPLPRGNETLLVVEDEPSVRHLASRVLNSLGYEVLSASNGQDALHVLREHQGSAVRLVITDVIMPLMGGKVMAEWMKTTQPDLKVLFTSGYTEDAFSGDGLAETTAEFLPKPYTPATLARKVRQILDDKSS